ncbi:hypothetical protein [Enemella sp. A6]|uniref:hypothetical protein n=1 Tax=Enemella sp. A6 TaxID=3440152 RepID=UPI003EB6966B
MSGWPSDDHDDLDPTAALSGSYEEPEYTEEGGEPEGEPFVDDSESVKVWVDEDGLLVKVYLSNRWRERSKDPLAERFQKALGQAQANIEKPRPLPTSDLPGRQPGAEIPLDTVVRRLLELAERRRQLKQKPADQVRRSSWTGTVGTGTSADHKVEVVLDRDRRTERLTIDDAWARTARAEKITEAVLEAHRAAYEAHVPGEYTVGEFGELAQEAAALANELMPRTK